MSSLSNNLIIFSLLCLAALAGCKENPCKEVDCGPYGTCENGVCVCEEGYTLDSDSTCNQRLSSLIEGVYRANVTGCTTGDYDLTIQGSNVFDEVLVLVNLGGYTCSGGEQIVVEASISSSDQFVLESATYCDQYKLNGSGVITDEKIIITYDVEYIGSEATGELVTETCKVTLDRS